MYRAVGIIGCGAWGRNYIRVFQEHRGAKVVACADANPAALNWVKEQYPDVEVGSDPADITRNPALQAVVIATPASTHCELACLALAAGKDVLVEKPLALTSKECDTLATVAAQHNRILMVGHTFLYNDSVRKVHELIKDGDFGRIYYLVSRRNNLGPLRDDVSVIWDLAPHDISILNHLVGAMPVSVNAHGKGFLSAHRPDVAFLTLYYPNDIVGHIQVSWIDSHKIRDLIVIGDRYRIVFDDLNITESVRVYEKGIAVKQTADTYGEFQYLQRDGAIISPKLERREPLKNLIREFLDCCESRRRPLADGVLGGDVVRVLEACEGSLAAAGTLVTVKG